MSLRLLGYGGGDEMKTILMLVLALTVSGCEIIGAVSIISDVV